VLAGLVGFALAVFRIARWTHQSGLADSTIVAIAADHGDEFKEHGNYDHSKNLYNQVLRVPLLVHLPGAAPRVVSAPVSLTDLGPTLVDLAGLTGPAGQNGRSPRPGRRRRPGSRRAGDGGTHARAPPRARRHRAHAAPRDQEVAEVIGVACWKPARSSDSGALPIRVHAFP
jgi:arylsulfatase A-like enzyme